MNRLNKTSLILLSLGILLQSGSASSQDSALGLFKRQGDTYADAVVHGNGLTSLQYQEERGGPTREIQSGVAAPQRIRIEKEGDYVSKSVAGENEALHTAGGSFRIKLSEPFFVGPGVCAHDNNALEKAVFSNVEMTSGRAKAAGEPLLESTLEIVAIASKDQRVVYQTRDHIEAPNWSRDGKYFLFNRSGRIYTLPVAGGAPQSLDTGFATQCNNDHGLSPDGSQLVISDQSQERKSLIYVDSSNLAFVSYRLIRPR
jgi:TolB protein